MKAGKKLRSWARIFLACLFWLHALGITHLFLRNPHLTVDQRRDGVQILLLSVIFFYSLLAANGWFSLAFDLFYVYVSPAWLFLKISWRTIKISTKKLILKHFADRQLISSVQQSAAAVKANQSETKSFWQFLFQPLQQFALLWCLVTLETKSKTLIYIGLVAIVVVFCKAVVGYLQLVRGTVSLLEKFAPKWNLVLQQHFKQLIELDPASQEFLATGRILRVYKAALDRLRNRSALDRITAAITACVAIPYYGYLSILGGFITYNVARLYGVQWTIGDAIVDSMFAPIAFTDLPHILIIRVFSGLQVGLLVIIGYQAVFRQFSARTETLATAAEKMARTWERAEIRARILAFEARANSPAEVVTAPLATEMPKPTS